MHHIGLTHFPVGEHLCGFSFLAIVNVASMVICVTSICVSTVLGIGLPDHMVLLLSGMLKSFLPSSEKRESRHIGVLTNTCPSLS